MNVIQDCLLLEYTLRRRHYFNSIVFFVSLLMYMRSFGNQYLFLVNKGIRK